MSLAPAYTYRAVLTKVVDGDTIHATVDVGFRTYMTLVFRFYGINAPEIATPEGKASKQHLGELLAPTGNLILKTYKDPEK